MSHDLAPADPQSGSPAPAADGGEPLVAYPLVPEPLALRPAPHERAWMDETAHRLAYRCLPLVVANQMGWELLCPARVTAVWLGGPLPESTRFRFAAGRRWLVGSRFGDGIVTFTPGYLFRTPPGVNLWVRGPVNRPKDGASPLEGVVESDWSPYTFTMSWKLTRPGLAVTFEEGEPIGLIVPVPRGQLAGFAPRVERLAADPGLERQYHAWRESRERAAAEAARGERTSLAEVWDLGYLRGEDRAGQPFAGHEVRLGLRPFARGAPRG
jgi:hypothetical protein